MTAMALILGSMASPAGATEGLSETGVEFCTGRIPFERPGAVFDRAKPAPYSESFGYLGHYVYQGARVKVWAADRWGLGSDGWTSMDTPIGSVSLAPPYGGALIQFIFLCGYTIDSKEISRDELIEFAQGLKPKTLWDWRKFCHGYPPLGLDPDFAYRRDDESGVSRYVSIDRGSSLSDRQRSVAIDVLGRRAALGVVGGEPVIDFRFKGCLYRIAGAGMTRSRLQGLVDDRLEVLPVFRNRCLAAACAFITEGRDRQGPPYRKVPATVYGKRYLSAAIRKLLRKFRMGTRLASGEDSDRVPLRGVSIEDGIATIDFMDFDEATHSIFSTSSGPMRFLDSLYRTAFQFPTVRGVSLYMNGACTTLYGQTDRCVPIVKRDTWMSYKRQSGRR